MLLTIRQDADQQRGMEDVFQTSEADMFAGFMCHGRLKSLFTPPLLFFVFFSFLVCFLFVSASHVFVQSRTRPSRG